MPGPSFAPTYVAPGGYVAEQNISNPTAPQGLRTPAAIGQGSKTLLRFDDIIKGTVNGQDGPLANNTVVDILQIVDSNNVLYTKGVDFLLARSGANGLVDWSPKASLTGTVDLTTLTYPAQLDGKTLRLQVNGGTSNPADQAVVLTLPANAADVVNQINNWHSSLAGVASLVGNKLVLSANSVVIETGNAASILGFTVGQFASVQEPATGVKYRVFYTSDKVSSEYNPKLFSNMNDLISWNGPLNPPTVQATGTTVSATTTTLTVAGTPWVANAWVGYYVKITGGTGMGQVRVVISNTTNTITISQPWSAFNQPDGTSTFMVTDVNDNSISRGAQTMTDAGASFIVTSQYADDLFDSLNIKLAIDNLQNTISGTDPECLVLMRGIGATELSIIAYLKAHVDKMSAVTINKFRVAVIGMADGIEDFTVFTGIALGTQDRRITVVNITSINKNFGYGLEEVDGSYVAAGYAGVYCDPTVNAGEPITYKSLAAVFDIDTFIDPFLTDEKNQMASAGITVIERNGLDLIIRHALTTDNRTTFSWEAKLTRSADYVSRSMRTMLTNTFTGKRFTRSSVGSSDILLLAKSSVMFLLNGMIPDPQIIVSYGTDVNATDGNVGVTQNASVPQELDIVVNIALTTDVVWEYALIGFAVG